MPRIETDAQAWAWLVKWKAGAMGRNRREVQVSIGRPEPSVKCHVLIAEWRDGDRRWISKERQADTLATAVRKVRTARWE